MKGGNAGVAVSTDNSVHGAFQPHFSPHWRVWTQKEEEEGEDLLTINR